jgi:hypothetical protein
MVDQCGTMNSTTEQDTALNDESNTDAVSENIEKNDKILTKQGRRTKIYYNPRRFVFFVITVLVVSIMVLSLYKLLKGINYKASNESVSSKNRWCHN